MLKVDKAQQLSSSQTPQFFELLTSLLNHYFSVTQADPSTYPRIVEPTELIKRVYNQLENYQSQETKTSTVSDHTLVGLISLAKTVLLANPGILNKNECDAFLNMLVQKCLFNQAQEPYGGHITAAVDL